MLFAGGQAHQAQDLAGGLPGLVAVLAAHDQRHRHVVQRGELRQQVVELVDEAQAAVAHRALAALGQPDGKLAVHRHRTAGRHVQEAQDMQQRALAGARGADDGDHLAARHGQADVAEHFDARGAFVVDLDDVVGLQRGSRVVSHGAAPGRVAGARRANWDTGSPAATAPGRSGRWWRCRPPGDPTARR